MTDNCDCEAKFEALWPQSFDASGFSGRRFFPCQDSLSRATQRAENHYGFGSCLCDGTYDSIYVSYLNQWSIKGISKEAKFAQFGSLKMSVCVNNSHRTIWPSSRLTVADIINLLPVTEAQGATRRKLKTLCFPAFIAAVLPVLYCCNVLVGKPIKQHMKSFTCCHS